MRHIAILLIIFVFAVSLIAGCKKDQTPQKKPMATKQAQRSTPQSVSKEKVEIQKIEPEEYKYDAGGRRDPFLSLITITKQKPVKKKGASPIESYEIDEIRLLAIASDDQKHYALIMLPDKKTYTITEGMTLGLEGGKVETITSDHVVIREYIKDYRGELKPRDTILKLHKGEE